MLTKDIEDKLSYCKKRLKSMKDAFCGSNFADEMGSLENTIKIYEDELTDRILLGD